MDDRLARLVRGSLAAFAAYEWGGFWLGQTEPESHVRRTLKALEDCFHRRCRRLILTFPPRHYKTTMLERYVAWSLGRDPDRRFMYLSYGTSLAEEKSREIRGILANPRYQALFPHTKLAKDSKSVGRWNMDGARGGMLATGILGGITGFGATDIIIDDPFKNSEEAESLIIREKVWAEYLSSIYTRGEPTPEDAVHIILHTRWHEEDLIGKLLKIQASERKEREEILQDDPDWVPEEGEYGQEWTVLNFPALAKPTAEVPDPLGRKAGEPLLFSLPTYRQIRKKEGPRNWAALYQQEPVPEDAALFRNEYFIVCDHAPLLKRTYRYWDLALTAKESADFTAGALVGIDTQDNLWVLDVVRIQAEWPEVKKLILSRATSDPPGTIVAVEDVAHQAASLQLLRRHPLFIGTIPLISCKPRGKKDSRMRAGAWAAHAADGRLRVLRGRWNDDFINEALHFTGKPDNVDDQVDAVSGAAGLILFQKGEDRYEHFEEKPIDTHAAIRDSARDGGTVQLYDDNLVYADND